MKTSRNLLDLGRIPLDQALLNCTPPALPRTGALASLALQWPSVQRVVVLEAFISGGGLL